MLVVVVVVEVEAVLPSTYVITVSAAPAAPRGPQGGDAATIAPYLPPLSPISPRYSPIATLFDICRPVG